MACQHKEAIITSSSHARNVGFIPRTSRQIAVAAGLDEIEARDLPRNGTYPAPLVLPGDDLAWDPKWPAQGIASTKRCLNQINRDPGGRHVIYVAAPPTIGNKAPQGMQDWSKLRLPKAQRTNLVRTPKPQTQDVIDYLSAVFHGLPVKLLPERMQFTHWHDEAMSEKQNSRGATVPAAIALETSQDAIRIRCRSMETGLSTVQLNLNDLLDVAIDILPQDAYALLLLIEQDIYEDEADDFCCGRAFGGSRIACVSAFRYHPAADIEQDVDIEHAWPASHCAEYVERLCGEPYLEPQTTKVRAHSIVFDVTEGPLRSAIESYPKNIDSMTLEAYTGLWLGRFCRTASHELGHCFGMDHCVYYACVMQGTASVAEDARQPPYLCPVDLAKLLYTTSATAEEHHTALLEYCSKFDNMSGALFWNPFAAWLKGRLSTTNT